MYKIGTGVKHSEPDVVYTFIPKLGMPELTDLCVCQACQAYKMRPCLKINK